MAKVLIGCERSGRLRQAFKLRGHQAFSNDLVASDDGSSRHLIGDTITIGGGEMWDLGIFHPPCTYLSVSGARWFKDPARMELQRQAIVFAETIWSLDIPRIVIENPVGVLSTQSKLGKPTQIVQPWQFGDPEYKKTCLWIRGLPLLKPTKLIALEERKHSIHEMSATVINGMTRQQRRSVTFQGIANAMAKQWGIYLPRRKLWSATNAEPS